METHAHDHAPNHHAHFRRFTGAFGLVGSVGMLLHNDDRGPIALEVAAVQPGEALVDVGCGPGNAARLAAKRGAKVIGVDPAPAMLRLGRLVSVGRGVRYQRGAAEALPLGDATADVVWTLASVHHWPDLEGGLREVVRVLRPAGRFLALETHVEAGAGGRHSHGLGSHGWTNEQAEVFAELCEAHGLRGVRVERHEAKHRAHLTVFGARDDRS